MNPFQGRQLLGAAIPLGPRRPVSTGGLEPQEPEPPHVPSPPFPGWPLPTRPGHSGPIIPTKLPPRERTPAPRFPPRPGPTIPVPGVPRRRPLPPLGPRYPTGGAQSFMDPGGGFSQDDVLQAILSAVGAV